MPRDYPAFLFYPEDFAAGTAAMSPLEVGVYMRCLCHQWSHGFIPNDVDKIARISGATPAEAATAWPSVADKFTRSEDGTLCNARLELERQKLKEQSKRRVKAGRKGAKARWQTHGNGNADAIAIACDEVCDSDSKTMASRVVNANVDATASESEIALEDAFETFWKEFPEGRKKSKGRARTAFAKAAKKQLTAILIASAIEYAASDEGRGQFVKMPETWLNGECWNDDREAWKDRSGRRDNSTVGKGRGERSL